ncbi:hypothetical protein [Pseudoduganella lutea]|uniref:Uncharacterized protein n=1 Tax=Pseudoduganella lutea TaxID=321985 RepID=A0A4V0Z318_9BURK|nr:hypothetical protein [Pseudoduganella lutea]QBE61893.1 hypothetical protein EWM63_01845 [Pseudoduganella lutea]
MKLPYSTRMTRRALALGFAAACGAGLGACASPEQKRQANLYQDGATCTEFGARSGTPEYTECMLTQQSRRDNKQRDSLEQTALTSQIARDSQEMSRKVRCDRDAKKDREAGLRPRRCD